MRKINLKNYEVLVTDSATGEKVSMPYAVKESLGKILCYRVDGLELYKRGALADKINNAGDEMLVEEDDYKVIKSAVEKIPDLGINELTLVRRIIDAEEVKVVEEKK